MAIEGEPSGRGQDSRQNGNTKPPCKVVLEVTDHEMNLILDGKNAQLVVEPLVGEIPTGPGLVQMPVDKLKEKINRWKDE